mmetsp:Transcript_24727/g.97653  ORF Transcript_24727/g.97653 Transcript_24727/m.97653 type:complete len:116 (-) Transcript_24727:4034-4381(-)
MSSDERSTEKVWISDQDDSRRDGAPLPDQFGWEGVEETDAGAGAGAGGVGSAGGGGGGSGGSGGESGGSDAGLPLEMLAILNVSFPPHSNDAPPVAESKKELNGNLSPVSCYPLT